MKWWEYIVWALCAWLMLLAWLVMFGSEPAPAQAAMFLPSSYVWNGSPQPGDQRTPQGAHNVKDGFDLTHLVRGHRVMAVANTSMADGARRSSVTRAPKVVLWGAACSMLVCANAYGSLAAVDVNCAPDAIRLCGPDLVKGRAAIESCMKHNWGSVGAACKTAVAETFPPKRPNPAVTVEKVPKPVVIVEKPLKRVTNKPLPNINPPTVTSDEPVAQPTIYITPPPQESTMETVLDYGLKGLAILGLLWLLYLAYEYVLKPVFTKATTYVESDFTALKARVSAVESAVGIVPPVVAAPVVAPVAVAPVAPVAPVVNPLTATVASLTAELNALKAKHATVAPAVTPAA